MRSILLVVIVALLGGGVAVAFSSDDSRAVAQKSAPSDAGADALLPPTAPMPDAGVLADAGRPM